ncbi:MAG: hypothetical protein M1832_000273 [Thelocarpon impressellum]|nr:MAG: hypothetical protein M1832_000273 [Thelocarpon impressellum]
MSRYAALGDSYAMGLGAGHAIKSAPGVELNTDCAQFSKGFPNLLNANDMIGLNPDRKFQYLACSGALVPDVRDKQVPKMNSAVDLVVLNAGGNDAHLATLLNYCVYTWLALWSSCETEMKSAQDAINAPEYVDDLRSLRTAIKPKLDSNHGRVYWVGYERFFDDTTTTCDEVTWAIGFTTAQMLTRERRTALNGLVDLVNSKIKAVCGEDSQCVFVDVNDSLDKFAGHYCQPGVNESFKSPEEAWNRELTRFYQFGTTTDDDTDDEKGIDQPQRRDDASTTYDNLTFEGAVANWVNMGLAQNKGIQAPDTEFNAQGSVFSGSFYRIFHRNKYGNGVVAMRILHAMDTEQGKMMNEPVVTVTASTCAAPTAAATSSATTTPSQVAEPYASTGYTGPDEQDKCHVHITQTWACGSLQMDKNSFANLQGSIQLFDAAGKEFLTPTDMTDISEEKPGSFKSKLEDALVLSADIDGVEHSVSFALGTEKWKDSDNSSSYQHAR